MITSVLPKYLDATRWVSVAQAAAKVMLRSPSVIPDTVLVAVYKAAKAGLDLDESKGHAHLIAYGKVCQMIPGYKGLIHLARLSGEIRDIRPVLVQADDDFKVWADDTGEHIEHHPNFEADTTKPPKAGYAFIYWKDGAVTKWWAPYADIQKIAEMQITKAKKAAAKYKKEVSTPWLDWRKQMDLKTIVRAAAKFLPQSDELAFAVKADMDAEAGKAPIPTEFEEIIDDDAVEALEQQTDNSSKPETTEPQSKSGKSKAMPKAEYEKEAAEIIKQLMESDAALSEPEILDILVKSFGYGDYLKAPAGDRRQVLATLRQWLPS